MPASARPCALYALLFAWLWLGLLGSGTAAAQEGEACNLSPADLLSEPPASYGRLAYTEMISDGASNWVGRFDPNDEQQPGWRLQYVSGAQPSPSQRADYAARKAHQPIGFELSQVVNRIDLNSIRMTSRSRRSQWFGFEPRVQEGQSSAYIEPLAGYVSRPTDGRCHLIVEISADEPYAPAPGVWISDYRWVVVLGRRGPDQLLYPLLIQSELKGTAMPGTRIDETVRYRYSYNY